MTFSVHHKSSATDEAVQHIAELIHQGVYAPGDRLPGERQLSQTLGVGRTTVREAIRILEAMGLLEVRQGRGTFVKDASDGVLQMAFPPPVVTDTDKLQELFELRQIVEVAAAGRAARRATPAHLDKMRFWQKAIETHIARDDPESVVTADVEFHREIIKATGNDTLVHLMDSIVHLLRDMRYDSSRIPDLLPQVVKGHRAILAAIEAGEPEQAERAMNDHLAEVAAKVLEFWRTNRPEGPK
ncbi:MAG: FadR family transcriptional regulator [Caldilineae bacterium]|nr:MAG: FadR family transcriptional regulator [Caldilineae bacterium]